MHLRERVLRDVNRAGYAPLLVSQVAGRVAGAGLAVAAWASALAVEADQAGGDQGAGDFELLDPGGQVAGDQGGMFGDGHTGWVWGGFGGTHD